MRFSKLLMVLCALLLFAAQANALPITPTTGSSGVSRWTGTSGPGMPSIEADIAAIMAVHGTVLPELYKADYGQGTESGALAANYATTFSGDPNNALITHQGSAFVGPEAFLLVKDGNAIPVWYLFDLTELGWNGTDDLALSGFWPGPRGAISHVSLYGSSTSVPEPSTMLLLGLGMIGLAGFGRKKLFKNS